MEKLSTVSVRILQGVLRDPEVGNPCPGCGHSLNEGDLIVCHPAGAVDHSRVALRLQGPDAGRLYLAAFQANLLGESYNSKF